MRKLTHKTYVEIELINSSVEIPDVDKALYTVCAVYSLTEQQLDLMKWKKVEHMVSTVEKLFKSEFKLAVKKLIGLYKINYDIENISFGQYIELAYFLQFNSIDKANYVLASVAKTFRKTSHIQRADYFTNCNAGTVIMSYVEIRKRFNDLNKKFKSLFSLDTTVYSDEEINHPFNKRYGWIYSAKTVAKFNGVTLDEAFEYPVKRALNDLLYLKEESKYMSLLSKKK